MQTLPPLWDCVRLSRYAGSADGFKLQHYSVNALRFSNLCLWHDEHHMHVVGNSSSAAKCSTCVGRDALLETPGLID